MVPRYVSKQNNCDVDSEEDGLGKGGGDALSSKSPVVTERLVRVFQFYTGYSLRLTQSLIMKLSFYDRRSNP